MYTKLPLFCVSFESCKHGQRACAELQNACNFIRVLGISLICDKSVTTQNLAFLSHCYRKKHLQMHF